MSAPSSSAQLSQLYDAMYQERRNINPGAFSLEYWQDHFAFQAVRQSPAIRGRVLDLGCGTGEIDILLAHSRPDIEAITALDISALALTTAIAHRAAQPPELASRIDFRRADLTRLPFDDDSFDSAFISHVAEHLQNPSLVFREITRVLRPGGTCLVIVPRSRCHDDPDHKWHLEPEEWCDLLSRYGDIAAVSTGDSNQQIAISLKARSPRVVGMLRVKNEERFLAKALDSLAGLVDAVAVLDDGSNDATPEICRSHRLVTSYERQEGMGLDEVRDREHLLQMALALDPDWVISIDGDEVIESGGARLLRHEVSSAHPFEGIFSFDVPYLWDSENQFRFDGPYSTVTRHPRMFRVDRRNRGALHFRESDHGANFHGGSVPAGVVGNTRLVPVRLLHYGYIDKDLRARKLAFYTANDPNGATAGYYDHLLDQPHQVILPLRSRSEALEADPKELTGYYTHLRDEILERVPVDARTILELGCATGRLGRAIKERQQCFLAGIEIVPEAAMEASRYFDMVHVGDAETVELPYADGTFDFIICADVLEHLVDPAPVLERLRLLLKPGGRLLVSIPNIRNMITLAAALDQGRWKYEDEGILDRTHLRFFTRFDFERLLLDTGYRVVDQATFRDGRVTYQPTNLPADISMGRVSISGVDDRDLDELLALQLCFLAERPTALDSPRTDGERLPKASIVVVAEGRSSELLCCLSAIADAAPDGKYEVVIVDNATRDDTASLLASLDGDVRIVRSSVPLSFGEARNLGAASAIGEWLVFVDERAVLRDNWWSEIVGSDRAGSASIVCTTSLSPSGDPLSATATIGTDGLIRPLVLGQPFIAANPYCVAVRRTAFEEGGTFDAGYVDGWYAFADLMRRIDAGVDVATHPVAVMAAEGDGLGNADDLVRYWESWHEVLDQKR